MRSTMFPNTERRRIAPRAGSPPRKHITWDCCS